MTKKIDENLKKEFPSVEWKAIAGISDKLSHDYRGIDPNIVWSVIQKDLDKLKDTAIHMLPKIDYDQEALDEALKTKYYSHLNYLITG